MRSTLSRLAVALVAVAVAAVVATVALTTSTSVRTSTPTPPVEVSWAAPANLDARAAGPAVEGVCVTHRDAPALVTCVPVASPDGGPVVALHADDGSAGYLDGWSLDPDGPDGDGGPSWVRPDQAFRVEHPRVLPTP